MPNIITSRIDVRKLDKARFFEGKPDAQGHRPLWADLVHIPRKEVGKYGATHICKQSKKKDEQVEMPIIGDSTERGSASAAAPRQAAPARDDSEDVPF